MNRNWIVVYISSSVVVIAILFMLVTHILLGSSIFNIRSFAEFVKYTSPSLVIPLVVFVMLLCASLMWSHVLIFIFLLFLVQCAWVVTDVAQIVDPISRAYGFVRLWQPVAGSLAALAGYFLSRHLR